MRYGQPRQMHGPDGSPGLWHFTETHDNRTHPVGYCRDGCPGHETADEAREHMKRYYVDHAHEVEVRTSPDALRPEVRCQAKECREGTLRGFALPDVYTRFSLCPAHLNRETLATLVVVSDYAMS